MNRTRSQTTPMGIDVPLGSPEHDALATRVVAKIALLTEEEIGQLAEVVQRLLAEQASLEAATAADGTDV